MLEQEQDELEQGQHVTSISNRSTNIFSYTRYEGDLQQLKDRYSAADPFPYIALDDFLEPDAARAFLDEFPPLDSEAWFHMRHYNENSRSLNEPSLLGPAIKSVIKELHSERFLQWLSQLIGVDNLIADKGLEGSGVFATLQGGFLNVHADFTVHQYQRNWARRCNLLLYLNTDWQENYNGNLELWDRQMTHCVQSIAPIYNRAVIFSTDFTSFHGYPEPIACPEGMARRTLNLYYYTEEETPPVIQSTEFRARPGDGIKGLWIWLDKKVVWIYDFLKRRLGISDRFGSNLMKIISKLRDD